MLAAAFLLANLCSRGASLPVIDPEVRVEEAALA
jgi:hypothetical protein